MLYNVTIKRSASINGVRLEKGMSVEVVSQSFNLLGTWQNREVVNNAFKAKYGVDVGRANALTPLHLDVVKIN